MNIIFDSPQVEKLRSRHIVLELDTFIISNLPAPVKSFCIVEQVPLSEINVVDHYVNLHCDLIEHFRKKNWTVCKDAIQLLLGRWGGELDTFYIDLKNRVSQLEKQALSDDWTGFIKKS